MTGPKDAVQQYAVPVDVDTGRPLTDRHVARMRALMEAVEPLYAAMHAIDGSTEPGEHQDHTWTSRRMAIAATHLETALMYMKRVALE